MDLFRITTGKIELAWGAARGREPAALAGREPAPGRLVVTRRGASRVEVWRAGVPEAVAGDPELEVGPRLYEQTDYRVVLRATGARRVALGHRDPVVLREIAEEDGGRLALGYVNFLSQVGRSEFTVFADGRPELDVEVEVFPTKLDYASDYETLLAEVQEILTGLAVEYLRSTYRLGRGAWVPQPSHVEWLALLRHVAEDLERAVERVASRPERGLTREPVPVRLERVKRVDASVRAALRRGGRVRERIDERRARPTLDTPEHRWLAHQLALVLRRLASLRREEAGREPTARRTRTLDELAALESRVARLSRAEPLASASGPVPAGFASLKLLNAPGYREAYRACLVLALGLRIEGGPVRLSVKDLGLLYEYWCYLALLRIVSEETGRAVPVRDLFAVTRRGLHVELSRGRETTVAFGATGGRRVTVRYNPLFGGDTVLVPQQPDVLLTLEDPEWPPLHLLVDAKYRVDASPEYLERYLTPGPPEDAVNVLHRYRDAILERDRGETAAARPKRSVVQAAAAFPYRESSPGAFRESRLWRALDRLGVGAVPALPGDTEYLREWLRGALARGGWALADHAVDHRAVERARRMREAAEEPALVARLRDAGPAAHFAWIAERRLYYAPLSRTEPLQLAAKWVAVYLSEPLRESGAVTHVAAVEGVDVLERSEVGTPWPALRPAGELQVVYRLGEVRALERAVEGSGEVARWTSRLALDRAHTTAELSLTTEQEWRLFEELAARGVAFRVSGAGFLTAGGTELRYAGADGFEVRAEGSRPWYAARAEDAAEVAAAARGAL